jgi:hypothetical protein
MRQTKSAYDLDPNLTRNSLILENIRIAADESTCLLEIVDKVFKEIARLVVPNTLEEALTGSEEGAEGEERDEAENGGGDGEKDEEPEIVGEGFEGKGVDSKHGNSASTLGRESGLTGKTTGFYLYDIALALAEGDLDEARLGVLKDGYLAFIRLADVGAKQCSQLAGLH